ncbi:hypothetical protein LSH36_316g05010 [Paralvinella palmiformis]|uniref:Small RNA 2'-O-methyltransferase n=1 Tax=Paralvinella palmiformis TaxID=53620 RepID=A0AAD9JHP6_9ANNE|nr:hypothetical protein LSH36_316g05010 [Paralvinella palmiformis]
MHDMVENQLLIKCQHGFIKGRSCVTHLLAVLDKWTEALGMGNNMDAVYRDFSKAFDSVPHQRLLMKIKVYGISEVVHSSINMFAEDTKIFRTVNNPEQAHILQDDQEALEEWSSLWQLRFNAEKCKVMHLGSRNKRIEYHMHKDGVQVNLQTTELEKDLGVYVDTKLTFSMHCEKGMLENKTMVRSGVPVNAPYDGSSFVKFQINNMTHYEMRGESNYGIKTEGQIELSRFDPPLYRQRYQHVAEVLDKECVRSVVDLGCSEHKVLPVFKSVPTIEIIVCVDIDQAALSSNPHLLQPLLTDYLARRSRPLVISLYHGDAQLYDVRLANTEAVTLIEVIEHLSPDILKAVSSNVFSNLHPRVIVITTPNVEYNVVFGDGTGFRHWDHKFEWTRAEFEKWCGTLAEHYGYSVSYSGVGSPPADLQYIGYCTQVAVFKLLGDWHTSIPVGMEDSMPYQLLKECVHPHRINELNTDDAIAMETSYYLRMLISQCLGNEHVENTDYIYDSITRVLRVSPSFLLNFSHIKRICPDVKTLIMSLSQKGFQFTDDKGYLIHSQPVEDRSDSDDDNNDDNDDENRVNVIGLDSDYVNGFNNTMEDWNDSDDRTNIISLNAEYIGMWATQ